MYNSNPKMQLSTASHQLNSALFFMLEQIGLTGLFNQKVKCENKLRKTRLSFPQASHSSDTFFLDSKLIFFLSSSPPHNPLLSPWFLPSFQLPASPDSCPALPDPEKLEQQEDLLLQATGKGVRDLRAPSNCSQRAL